MIVCLSSNLLKDKLNFRFSADTGAGAGPGTSAEGLEGGVSAAAKDEDDATEIPVEVLGEGDGEPDSDGEAREITVAEEEYQKLVGDLERFRDIALRSQADLDNYRKRMVRELEEGRRYANNDLLERLLPIVDNFELGLMAAKQSTDQNIYLGMSMVQRQLADFLEASGLKAIPAEGQPFDPKVHEAVSQEASSEVPAGQVIRLTRKGYKLGDRLLRAANVVVSTGPEA